MQNSPYLREMSVIQLSSCISIFMYSPKNLLVQNHQHSRRDMDPTVFKLRQSRIDTWHAITKPVCMHCCNCFQKLPDANHKILILPKATCFIVSSNCLVKLLITFLGKNHILTFDDLFKSGNTHLSNHTACEKFFCYPYFLNGKVCKVLANSPLN